MLGVRLRRSTWGAGVAVVLAGCDPTISFFDVQPRRVCAGDTVHITWKARGTPHLLAVRRTEDSVDIIRYTIVSEARGKQASSSMDVITFNRYNPGFDSQVATNGSYELRLPGDKMDIFLAKKLDILNESMQLLLKQKNSSVQ